MRLGAAAIFFVCSSLIAQQPDAVRKVLGLLQALNTTQHVSFALSNAELNDYLQYSLQAAPRPGVQSAVVKVFPYNYISTYAVVDFDAVERWHPGAVPTVLKPVLSGRKAILVDCRFRASAGKATFSVEKAYFGRLRLPAFFVQTLMQKIAARQPEHYDLTKPLALPFGLRNIWSGDGVLMGEK